jgi:hypothetical protein
MDQKTGYVVFQRQAIKMITIESAIKSLCDMISTKLGVEVTLGCLDKEKPGIYVWPWMIIRNHEVN